MRAIKFRAWNKRKKCWAKNLCLYLDDSKIGDVSECFHNQEVKEDYILEQYVDFEDFYGKEIYEGDICRINTGESFIIEGKITMIGGSTYCGGSEVKRWMNPIIIGNIHENPDIL